MADRSHKARSGLALLALVAAGLIAGLWLYLLQTDVVGQMRRAEDERCYLHLGHLRQELGGELDRVFLEAQEMGTAVSIDTQSQNSFKRLSEAPAGSFAPKPPHARAILLFGLERQEKYSEAMALFPTRNKELSGDLLLLKARCLASLGHVDEAMFLLQQARSSGGYQVFGPLPFWVLTVLLEAKLGSPKQRQQLIQEIAKSESELTAKSALTLADLLPSDCKEPLSRFLLRARLFRAMESNPIDLEDNGW